MKIHIATDHAGLELKNIIRDYLIEKGYNVTDHGDHEYDAWMITLILFFHAQKQWQLILKVAELF